MKVRALVCVLLALPVMAWGQTAQSATDLLHPGLEAMGGEQKIRALNTFHFQGLLVRNMLEQSERPEGPYILENNQVEEWRDLAHNQWKSTVKLHVAMMPEFAMSNVVSEGAASVGSGGQAGPGSGEQLQEANEALTLNPERVLITALASPDLIGSPISRCRACRIRKWNSPGRHHRCASS